MDGFRGASVVVAAMLLAGCQSPDLAVGAIPHGAVVAPVLAPNVLIPASTAMPAGSDAAPPSGFVAFCNRDPEQCQPTQGGADVVALDAGVWRLLWQVNTAWNTAVKPMDDDAHYGVVDYWTIPKDGYGDCEDYALGKRKSLIDFGLPEQALHMAVVRTPDGTAHAVLDVATTRGDYVLDNLNSAVLPWNETGYAWVARQRPSETHWAFIGPAQSDNASIATADIMPY